MEIDPDNLPQDAAALRCLVASLLEDRDTQERRIRQLQHMLEQLLRARYGPRRERLNQNQLFLFAAEIRGRTTTSPHRRMGQYQTNQREKRTIVEREARTMGLVGEARKALRQAKSVPILSDIKAYLEREQPAVLPKSPEGTAISYTLSNWDALTRYCSDGDLEIDNNSAERSLRGVAVGRRNWTFLGSDNGGQMAAILTSFTTTCKRLRVDPFEYLRDVFQRISTHPRNNLDDLLPDKWKLAWTIPIT
jgi:hypothetical protein